MIRSISIPWLGSLIFVPVQESARITKALDEAQASIRRQIERDDAHRHRITIDSADFRLLVNGEATERTCSCGERVGLLLDDIGFDKMLAMVGVAQAHAREREKRLWND